MFARIYAPSSVVLTCLVALNLSAGLTPVLAQCEAAKLLATDGTSGDYFGVSVAIDGESVVVGALGDDGLSGSAYVFRFDGSGWVEEQKLQVPLGGPEAQFGRSVAVCGDSVVVGAAGEWYADGGDWARVYRFDGVSWVEEDEFRNGNESRFGYSVAIDGDAIFIGAPQDGENGSDAGAVYVFRYDGSDWVQEAKLLAVDDVPRGDQFGCAVAIDGDTAVIGSWYQDDQDYLHGSAYVFQRDDNGTPLDPSDDFWLEQAKLMPDDPEGENWFGYAAALDGRTAVIGDPMDNDNASWAGAAYVFDVDPIPGDLDCDACVGQADLGILLADWNCTGGDCPGDCDGDGDTDHGDLGTLLAHWGEGCP